MNSNFKLLPILILLVLHLLVNSSVSYAAYLDMSIIEECVGEDTVSSPRWGNEFFSCASGPYEGMSSRDIYFHLQKRQYSQVDLADFTSDGCSSFPEGTGFLGHPNAWVHCCLEHDKAYFAGGTEGERKSADRLLRRCVKDAGFEIIGPIMYAGVRVGGGPYDDTTYRWGYGWPYGRDYGPLSSSEKSWVKSKLSAFKCKEWIVENHTSDPRIIKKTCD